MRFLIFNCLILASLSYLLTAQPGDSFSSWAKEFPDEFEKKFDSHFSQNLEQQVFNKSSLISEAEKKVNSETDRGVIEGPEQLANKITNEESIKKLIDDAIKESNQTISPKTDQNENKVVVSQLDKSIVSRGNAASPLLDTEQITVKNLNGEQTSMRDDVAIGEDFKNLEQSIQSGATINAVKSSKDVQKNIDEQQTFMSGQQRQIALTQLMQDMEMFYAEKLAR